MAAAQDQIDTGRSSGLLPLRGRPINSPAVHRCACQPASAFQPPRLHQPSHLASRGPRLCRCPLPPPPPPLLTRPPGPTTIPSPAVWKAAAYGDFEKLRELSEAEPEALHCPDEQGFFALQWAALNNRVAVLTYLLDQGCDVNAADGTGQTALHWAAVRGSTAALETLLRAGAALEARDSRWAAPGRSRFPQQLGVGASRSQQPPVCRLFLRGSPAGQEVLLPSAAAAHACPAPGPPCRGAAMPQGVQCVPRGGAVWPDGHPVPPRPQVERRY